MGKGRNGLPARWEIYKPVVNHVAGTRFLPFKVPLKEAILVPGIPDKSDWFTPALLCEMKPELKAIIDLTDTCRYYNPEEFISRGVCYKKINITGRGNLPSKDKLREFFNAVDEFTKALPEDALIGVHCTHGLNRTGYLICKYMVTRMEIDPEEAITRFEKARGHKIERDNYLNHIKYTSKSDWTTMENVRRQEYPKGEPYNKSSSRREPYSRPSSRGEPYSRPSSRGEPYKSNSGEGPYSGPNNSNWRSEPRAEPRGGGFSGRSGNNSRNRNNYSRYNQHQSYPDSQVGPSGSSSSFHGSPLEQCYNDGASARGNDRSSKDKFRWNRQQ